MSVHAAGLLETGLSETVGHADWPSGVEATPGVTAGTLAALLQVAPGPDAEHCSEPSGTLTLTSPVVPGDTHADPEVSDRVAQTTALCLRAWTALPTTRLAGGAAARATMLNWLATTTNASAKCALGRIL
jgi:hypothetical protein